MLTALQDTGKRRVVAEGRTSDLQGLRFTTTGYINGFPTTVLQLVEGLQAFDLAQGTEVLCHSRICLNHITSVDNVHVWIKPTAVYVAC